MKQRGASTQRQWTALSEQAPFVMWQRLLALAPGPAGPTEADRREWNRMAQEKLGAVQDGWLAMATEMMAAQQRLWQTAFRTAWLPLQPDLPVQWWFRGLHEADAVLAAGLKPAVRRVADNARRLKARR